MDFKKMTDLWMNALKKPKETFSAEKKNADFTTGAIYILIAGVIAGIIGWLTTMMYAAQIKAALGPMASLMPTTGGGAFVTNVIVGPIMSVISWIIFGGIILIFAKILGGKGSFVQQLYLMSLYMAPLAILTAILGLIPIIGGILGLLLMLYGLYLLTLATKEAHGFSIGKAVLSWLIPVIILALLMLMIVGMAISSFMGGMF